MPVSTELYKEIKKMLDHVRSETCPMLGVTAIMNMIKDYGDACYKEGCCNIG